MSCQRHYYELALSLKNCFGSSHNRRRTHSLTQAPKIHLHRHPQNRKNSPTHSIDKTPNNPDHHFPLTTNTTTTPPLSTHSWCSITVSQSVCLLSFSSCQTWPQIFYTHTTTSPCEIFVPVVETLSLCMPKVKGNNVAYTTACWCALFQKEKASTLYVSLSQQQYTRGLPFFCLLW
jgi:hypothetical protein